MQLSDADIDDDDDDDEEFFDSNDEDESDDDDGNDKNKRGITQNDSEDDHIEKKHKDAIILQGSLYVNEEGRCIYSGTWTMQRDLKEGKQQTRGAEDDKGEDGKNNNKEKKKTKFKLKSKKQLNDESEDGSNQAKKTSLLTLIGRNGDCGESSDKPQSILFDGFFVTDETDSIQPHRKVKERDVEITFSRILNPPARGSSNSTNRGDGLSSKRRYRVDGRGGNEFGAFSIEGTYTPCQQHDEEKKGEVGGMSMPQSLSCRKWYTPIIKPKKRRREEDEYGSDDDDDYEISGDEADFEEVIGLQSEAGMSIEELRKKYYGGGETLNVEDGISSTANKRNKVMEDDDDDGCGF